MRHPQWTIANKISLFDWENLSYFIYCTSYDNWYFIFLNSNKEKGNYNISQIKMNLKNDIELNQSGAIKLFKLLSLFY